jgi:hypothetical protein
MNIVVEETHLEVIEETDELVILEEIVKNEIIEVGNIIITETDLVINALTAKTDIHPDDLLLIEDSEAAFTRKKIKASRLSDGGQFT